jgi:hypothetical protein
MRRGLYEGVVLRLIRQAPFRCGHCQMRFFDRWDGPPKDARRSRHSVLTYLGLWDPADGEPSMVIFCFLAIGLVLGSLLIWAVAGVLGLGSVLDTVASWLYPAFAASSGG